MLHRNSMKPSTESSQITRRAALRKAAAAGLVVASSKAYAGAPITVAGKIDTEGALLGSLIAGALRAHELPVRTRLQLGPTSICRAALLAGAVDIYPEYTGNGASFFRRAGDPAWHDASAAWRLVRDLDAGNGVAWLAPAPANNGWGIAVRSNLSEELGGACRPPQPYDKRTPRHLNETSIKASSLNSDGGSGGGGTPHPVLPSLGDLSCFLSNGGTLLMAASVEFVESPDALPAFERSYGFRLRQNQLITLAGGNTAATLRAAAEGMSGINAGMAYSTDGALDALRLVLLTDPHHAQIVFQPAPVVRAVVLRVYPEITAILAPVFAALTLPVLRAMNAQISADGADPAQVAAQFLAHLA
jgi:osmoprotectant transport system substrate-binding protein